jgi:alpha 1,3-mannosyltransferase
MTWFTVRNVFPFLHRISTDYPPGDKETYWLAWELSNDLGYSFHQGAAGIMGKIEEHHIPEPRRLSKLEKLRLKAAHPELDDAQIDAAMEQPREPEGPPTNFTICAPQLLHLHLDGSPLWFNGWIMAKKEGNKKKEKFSTFERYSAEPREKAGEDDAWKLHEDNICCLTADETFEFTEKQRRVLDMIVDVARDVKSKGEI